MKSLKLLVMLCSLCTVLFVQAKDSDDLMGKKLMQDYISAYMKSDTKALMAMMVSDGQIDLWGTNADEHATNRDVLKKTLERDFSQAKTRIKASNLRSYLRGSAGVVLADWHVEYLLTNTKKWQALPVVRTTFAIEKHRGKWLLRHAHWSDPSHKLDEGLSFPYRG